MYHTPGTCSADSASLHAPLANQRQRNWARWDSIKAIHIHTRRLERVPVCTCVGHTFQRLAVHEWCLPQKLCCCSVYNRSDGFPRRRFCHRSLSGFHPNLICAQIGRWRWRVARTPLLVAFQNKIRLKTVLAAARRYDNGNIHPIFMSIIVAIIVMVMFVTRQSMCKQLVSMLITHKHSQHKNREKQAKPNFLETCALTVRHEVYKENQAKPKKMETCWLYGTKFIKKNKQKRLFWKPADCTARSL